MTRMLVALLFLSVLATTGVMNLDRASAAVVTFTVTKAADSNDGSCNADCSLREAITAANNNNNQATDVDVIQFAIPGAGAQLLQPTTALPAITEPVHINGISQGTAACNSHFRTILIQIDGGLAPAGSDGLVVNYTATLGSTISGVSMTSWDSGISLDAGTGHTVKCSNLGNNPGGGNDANQEGIEVTGANNVLIGSTVTNERNVISGNGAGIQLNGSGSGAIIRGNYIGVNAGGSAAMQNTVGINRINHGSTIIGGAAAGQRNVISGNFGNGIILSGTGSATIQGNYIGYGSNGTTTIINNGDAIRVTNIGAGNFATIGGIGAGQANRIFAGSDSGILVDNSGGTVAREVSIRGNQIQSTFLGINLLPIGEAANTITPNDVGDPDPGPNDLQNFPVISTAIAGAPGTITGTLNSTSNSTYQLDFYKASSACSAAHRDGAVYLGSKSVSTPMFVSVIGFTASISGFIEGDVITATATDSDGNTSEFSGCITATGQVPATFTVNSTNDANDGTCNAGHCSLREAILAANGNGNAGARDIINFNIPGGGAKTISLLLDLPTITQAVSVNGPTQPGAVCSDATRTVMVQLLGTSPDVGNGLYLSGIGTAGALVRGLSIGGFPFSGVKVESSTNVAVECNFLGVGLSGNTETPNGSGVSITNSPGTVIGGASPSKRNIISGNGAGVAIAGTGVTIQGNYIGLGADGATIVDNSFGVDAVGVSELLIGGTSAGTANVITGNTVLAIKFSEAIGANVRVFGNFIGYRPDGTTEVSSLQAGILLHSVNDGSTNAGLGFGVAVGGVGAGEANQVFVSGSKSPIEVREFGSTVPDRHVIRGNQLKSAQGLGIDLRNNEAEGTVNANDTLDPDAGANGRQNFPVLASATGGTPGTVTGTLNSKANQSFTIDFYRGAGTCGQPGTRDGEVYLGAAVVNTNGSGDATINAPIAAGFIAGALITATATDANGNTSEFSDCVTATGAPPTSFVVNSDNDLNDGTCDGIHCSLREAINAANANANPTVADQITFAIPGSGVKVINIAPNVFPPTITQAVSIDGTTQPGAVCSNDARNILIELRGGLTATAGLAVNYAGGAGSLIRGLAINSFGINGLALTNGSGHRVECNNLGLDAAGTTDLGNNGAGVLVFGATDSFIGNGSASGRNIISGNTSAGINTNSGSTNLTVSGNYIGVGPDGVTVVPNLEGMFISNSEDVLIEDNVFSGNLLSGLRILGGANGLMVFDNLFGYAADGVTERFNGDTPLNMNIGAGTSIDNVTLGLPSQGNRIIDVDGPAVYVRVTGNGSAQGVTIRGNDLAITSGSIGIDLGTNFAIAGSVTQNDSGDDDTGPNDFQNFPIISAGTVGQGASVIGVLNSIPSSNFTIDFYASESCRENIRDGQRYLGSLAVATNASGQADFTATSLGAFDLSEGITATATSAEGDTSEFSECLPIIVPKAVSSVSPVEIIAGVSDVPVSIFGTGFEPGDEVIWDGNTVTTTFVSDTQLDVLATIDLVGFTMHTVKLGVTNAADDAAIQVLRSSSDVNCDDTTDAVDALFALSVLAGLAAESGDCPADADQSGGDMDIHDLLHVRGEVSGLIAPLESFFQ